MGGDGGRGNQAIHLTAAAHTGCAVNAPSAASEVVRYGFMPAEPVPPSAPFRSGWEAVEDSSYTMTGKPVAMY